jgi:hypothetical protein
MLLSRRRNDAAFKAAIGLGDHRRGPGPVGGNGTLSARLDARRDQRRGRHELDDESNQRRCLDCRTGRLQSLADRARGRVLARRARFVGVATRHVMAMSEMGGRAARGRDLERRKALQRKCKERKGDREDPSPTSRREPLPLTPMHAVHYRGPVSV